MEMMTQYRIVGRLRKDTDFHVVDSGFTDKTAAEIRMQKIKEDAEREMQNKQRKVITAGCIGISTPYDSDYDLLDIKLQSRQVTKWGDE